MFGITQKSRPGSTTLVCTTPGTFCFLKVIVQRETVEIHLCSIVNQVTLSLYAITETWWGCKPVPSGQGQLLAGLINRSDSLCVFYSWNVSRICFNVLVFTRSMSQKKESPSSAHLHLASLKWFECSEYKSAIYSLIHGKFLHISKQMHIYVLRLRLSFILLFLDSTRGYCMQCMVTLRYAITHT